ncbi:hypothetical protein [Streptomyces sp. NPDC048057]|uniref:hypothetical protein n=1 Tax=Streptomyces sp. NPDC048057 TaxID=3155628 RepID=UPI0033F42692
MKRRHRHAVALAPVVVAGIGWHLWHGGGDTGLVVAAAVLGAHLVAAALGYWLLRRRRPAPLREHADAVHPVHDRAAERPAYEGMAEHPEVSPWPPPTTDGPGSSGRSPARRDRCRGPRPRRPDWD